MIPLPVVLGQTCSHTHGATAKGGGGEAWQIYVGFSAQHVHNTCYWGRHCWNQPQNHPTTQNLTCTAQKMYLNIIEQSTFFFPIQMPCKTFHGQKRAKECPTCAPYSTHEFHCTGLLTGCQSPANMTHGILRTAQEHLQGEGGGDSGRCMAKETDSPLWHRQFTTFTPSW